jgi:CRP-like cAMP-binding protein
MAPQTPIIDHPVTPAVTPRTNTLMSRLPRDAHQRLLSHCTRVPLHEHEWLAETGTPVKWAYLPCSGVVSMQTMTENAESVEVAMVGSEGLVGLPMASTSDLSPHTAVVVIPGEAFRLRPDDLQAEFEHNPALQRVLVHYWHALIADIAQGSACHRFHMARQRLARWLLSASDRTQSARIQMTQERLGQALGLQRTGVTAASIALQDAGAIKSRHGRITIIDRRRLESMACECYRLSRERLSSS